MIVLVGCGLWLRHADAEQRLGVETRFEARHATAEHFIAAYVAEIFASEKIFASRAFGSGSGRPFAATASLHGFPSAVLLDERGRLIASQPVNPAIVGLDMTRQYAHLRSAVNGVSAVSGVVPSAAEAKPVVGFAVPFESAAGRRVFSGAYNVENTPLGPFVRNATPFQTAVVLITDAAGKVVAGTEGAPAGGFSGLADAALPVRSRGYLGAGDARQFVASGPIEGTSWRLTFAVDADELFAPLDGPGRWAKWAVLLAAGVAALLALALSHRSALQRIALGEEQHRRRAILDTAADAFIGMDEKGAITDWNIAASTLLGWPPSEVMGRQLHQVIIPLEERAAHLASVQRFLDRGTVSLPPGPVRLPAARRDDTTVPVELTLSRLRWGQGWRFHGFLRDVTERERYETQLHAAAMSDSLTGLANRRALVDRLDQALARARRRHHSVAVIYLDVDKFKAINDRYGHRAGDDVLTAVALRLRATMRLEDVCARLGGDEFAVICEDLTAQAATDALLTRLRAALDLPYFAAGHTVRVTTSIGLAVSDGEMGVEQLLSRADARMYEEKATRAAFTALIGNQPPMSGD